MNTKTPADDYRRHEVIAGAHVGDISSVMTGWSGHDVHELKQYNGELTIGAVLRSLSRDRGRWG